LISKRARLDPKYSALGSGQRTHRRNPLHLCTKHTLGGGETQLGNKRNSPATPSRPCYYLHTGSHEQRGTPLCRRFGDEKTPIPTCYQPFPLTSQQTQIHRVKLKGQNHSHYVTWVQDTPRSKERIIFGEPTVLGSRRSWSGFAQLCKAMLRSVDIHTEKVGLLSHG